ncbi:hypothetical protein L3X38_004522 [Prunus dulcis]|uniref:Uncharacterized protein n=1 Tax=Prunus dulcis TaxID=3755 RepID=A0AAD5F367_PRUDU|nr:hypothetical protein L3X38_004522 [Prunus dulcis]
MSDSYNITWCSCCICHLKNIGFPSPSLSPEPKGSLLSIIILQKNNNVAWINQSLSLCPENQKRSLISLFSRPSISAFALLHSLQHSRSFPLFQPNYTSVFICVRRPHLQQPQPVGLNYLMHLNFWMVLESLDSSNSDLSPSMSPDANLFQDESKLKPNTNLFSTSKDPRSVHLVELESHVAKLEVEIGDFKKLLDDFKIQYPSEGKMQIHERAVNTQAQRTWNNMRVPKMDPCNWIAAGCMIPAAAGCKIPAATGCKIPV